MSSMCISDKFIIIITQNNFLSNLNIQIRDMVIFSHEFLKPIRWRHVASDGRDVEPFLWSCSDQRSSSIRTTISKRWLTKSRGWTSPLYDFGPDRPITTLNRIRNRRLLTIITGELEVPWQYCRPSHERARTTLRLVIAKEFAENFRCTMTAGKPRLVRL